MSARIEAPHHWLDGFVSSIDAAIGGAALESAISGPGWLSIRAGGSFLWIVAHGADRMAWISDDPLPRAWLDLLGRHARSPFPSHVRGRVAGPAEVLETDAGQADGFRVRLLPEPAAWLQVRFFPRPGGIWMTGPGGEELARQGRMDDRPLRARAAATEADFDADAHALRCREAWVARLCDRTRRTLRQRATQQAKRTRRRVWQLEGDLEQATRDLGLRARADLLAAHLHEIRPGRERVELTGFDGETVTIDLDPARSPAANLDRWYKRAARSERKVEHVTERLADERARLGRADARMQALESVDDDASLDTWLEVARAHELDPAPNAPRPASERGRPDADRLPYWTFEYGGFELRVGRSARDNDELLKRHSHGHDLWLHAQGVPGSHVIVRSGGRDVPRPVLAVAAALAGHHSRSRTSETVPVLVTERRHVRKPRRAAPGEVVPDRARTVFVRPEIPRDCRRSDDA